MLRVVHGPVNVGNQPWVLSRYERELGVRSDLVINYNTWLGYAYDRCLSRLADRSRLGRARRAWFGYTAPFRYNVLHYYFGLSFLAWNDLGERNERWFRDMRIARALGRKVFMTLQGCDVRLSSESARRNRFTPCHEGHCSAVQACRSSLDAARRRLIDEILPLAHRSFALNPELVHYVPQAVFVPYASVDVDRFEVVPASTRGPVVILHAPSDPSIKGSQLIAAAVERLRTRFPIEFVQVKGLPHAEAVKLYRRADLVIDQVLAGWYGGFAVEAMAMGKPVACYIREEDLVHVPAAMARDLPLIRLTPQTIEADLAAVLAQRQRLPELGEQARRYVLRWHRPRTIAAAMIRLYRDPSAAFELRDES
jgi:glycosyltransferase involved in cell wall biosynthesis